MLVRDIYALPLTGILIILIDYVEDHGIILPPALMNTAHPPMPGTSPYFMLPPGSLMLAPQAMSNQPILSHVNVMSPQFPYQRHLSPGMPLHLQMPNQIMPQVLLPIE